MPLPDPPARHAAPDDAEKRRRLRRMQWTAGALLGAAAVLYVAATALAGHGAAWPYVAAFAEAAMVGAIADWFAVTALFRHPLGLSFIPHTAVIPRNKDRIADNLGRFVQDEFFAPERIAGVIRELDPAARLAAWLAQPAHAQSVAAALARSLDYALGAFDDERVRRFLDRNVAALVRQIDLASLAGGMLEGLTRDGRHQALLDQVLAAFDGFMRRPEIKTGLATQMAAKVPLYFDRLKASVAGGVLERILDALSEMIAAIAADPAHPLRADFDRAVETFVRRLREDPEMARTVKAYQARLARNDALRAYVHEVWRDLAGALRADLARPDSALRARVAGVVQRAGALLRDDPAMRAWINGEILDRVPAVLDRLRPRIGALIAGKMKEWKDREVVDKLELNIGRDLQYIRINGTLVGGLVGLAIYAATELIRYFRAG
ncbi:DUF445 family protein [Pigmentiphaga soli]|uniref:DUF445 family protein n=1 Tax=Pigmentiphaga soli TaxID=1007095 RepID=A0ABP8HKD1_9BURK